MLGALALGAALLGLPCQGGCGGLRCAEQEGCCSYGNATHPELRCCRAPLHTFLDNAGWFVRKLSGLLILLLLFAVGYLLQRLLCPGPPRRRRPVEEEEEEEEEGRPEDEDEDEDGEGRLQPSPLRGSSQDSLLDSRPRDPPPTTLLHLGAPLFLQLPSYEEVKHLPSYEESMQPRVLPLTSLGPPQH